MSASQPDHGNDSLVAAARAALDRSAEQTPDDAVTRLAQARARAVAELSEPTPVRRLPSRWQPALAMAATVLIVVGGWQRALLPPLPALPLISDPLEAGAAQQVEMLDELEFLAWLELQGGEGEWADHAG